MRLLKLSLAVCASAVLVACGGGNSADPVFSGTAPSTKVVFKNVVVFGDSLSDVGTYTPATGQLGQAGFGGKFTTNPGPVWVETVARSLGTAVTPALVGFNGQVVNCPAAAAGPAAAATCTGYAQGGSRVTNPAGIGRNANGSGALTFPVITQITTHLQRNGGKFKDTDLVIVWGGNNDIFAQFGAFSAKVQAGVPQSQAFQEGAQALTLAAGELAAYIKTLIVANGGKYVVVMNLGSSANTPFGASLPNQDLRDVITTYVDGFNAVLQSQLQGAAVQYVDANAIAKDQQANPAKYGFTNITQPICNAAAISALTGGAVTDGTSLFCGAPQSITVGADVNKWLFADGVHPSTGGHKAFSDVMIEKLKAFGWQ
jgi:outer membrane lipase/esterase